MLRMLKSTWHEIRVLYFTISFDCVSPLGTDCFKDGQMLCFPCRKSPQSTSWKSTTSSSVSVPFCHFDPSDPSAGAFRLSPPETAKGHRPWAPGHTCWGRGETGEWGRVPLPVSHLISGLLCSGLLCAGHMYSRQRRGEVDGLLCRES